MEFTWQNEGKQQTLKKFLAARGVSHRLMGKIRRQKGAVLVDGKKVPFGTVLHQNEQVTLVLPEEKPVIKIAASPKPIEVLYEDANWLLVAKPAGLTSVPGPSNREDTLVNRVKYYLERNGRKNVVPHIITRLDRYTSGVVLLAKHSFAQGLIDKQVSNHEFDKRYYAIVAGQITKQHGLIEAPLKRKEGENFQIVSPDGRQAVTEYWLKANLAGGSLVEVKLHTGRTHQIRVHFQSKGHPLLGDELYKGPLDMGIERQALHAYHLAFNDPFTNKRLVVEAPLPSDMKSVLAKLKVD
ncbi:RluA family pseudouridine synthase [Ligilactobacillus agilis]|uniref:Pseudouridine synthase n=1 Tax=Ligilactobacillus agilis TaxID=1601 RepID=A0A226REH7_9LACO|nr:RluA family pseudouridine synthase [Ligilactobacillus agilis]MDK6810371.1 RluA family pseudouridine synthase [Ligilactobacillus agilis]MDM8281053.1 RluA family pseudouridine synthase [Ligilactobacillus agilis]OXC06585.1 RNA pseudouridine synthase [Ligilactobacillus agilis]OXC07965.1 RNA pseudouridine synthase [Ligilactobacillus agilis]OXC08713.1 RNA pseudouridine synthase [Ligilactobacillus agilis]